MKLQYKPGHKIKSDTHVYTCIGHEYIESRGIRYIFMSCSGSDVKWSHLYAFEIELLIN